MKDQSLSTPLLYLQVRMWILDRIKEGSWGPGDQIPSIQELASILGVSTSSVREGLVSLEADGVVVRRQGVGTFVQKRHDAVTVRLETLQNIFEMLGRTGKKVTSGLTARVVERPTKELVECLELSVSEPLLSIERLLSADGVPVAFSLSFMPVRVIGADVENLGENQSLLDYLEHERGYRVSQALCRIIPVQADEGLASHLDIPVGASLLLVEQVISDNNGEVIGFGRDYFNPMETDFQMVRVYR